MHSHKHREVSKWRDRGEYKTTRRRACDRHYQLRGLQSGSGAKHTCNEFFDAFPCSVDSTTRPYMVMLKQWWSSNQIVSRIRRIICRRYPVLFKSGVRSYVEYPESGSDTVYLRLLTEEPAALRFSMPDARDHLRLHKPHSAWRDPDTLNELRQRDHAQAIHLFKRLYCFT